jgi:hypothetical protein
MKKLLVATSLLLASASANAGVINAAGGVSWKDIPDTLVNFSTVTSFTQWWTNGGPSGVSNTAGTLLPTAMYDAAPNTLALAAAGATDFPELVGIGSLVTLPTTLIEFAGNGEPTCNGCQLTYAFGGFKFTTTGFNADDAWLNVYLDTSPGSALDAVNSRVDISSLTGAQTDRTDAENDAIAMQQIEKAVNGTLWLSMDIEDFVFSTDNIETPDPLNPLGPVITNPNASGGVTFFANITGGIAEDNIVVDSFEGGFFDIKASSFEANFLDDIGGDFVLNKYANEGAGRISAATVSEPGAIALFSLGLIGLGLTARRRMNK